MTSQRHGVCKRFVAAGEHLIGQSEGHFARGHLPSDGFGAHAHLRLKSLNPDEASVENQALWPAKISSAITQVLLDQPTARGSDGRPLTVVQINPV
jgi:hypothetical protein